MAKSGEKPTFDGLISSIPPMSLDRSMSREESIISPVAECARCSPESLGKELGLKPTVIDDVVREFSGDKVRQRGGVVRRWIEVEGKKATLKKLLDVLYHCDEIESIRLVNRLFSDDEISEVRHAPEITATAFRTHHEMDLAPARMVTAQAQSYPPSSGSRLPYDIPPAGRVPRKVHLSLERHPRLHDLSTPASELSDDSGFNAEEPVTAMLTGESHLVTGTSPSDNGLQGQAGSLNPIGQLREEMSRMKMELKEDLSRFKSETQQKDAEQDKEIKELKKKLKDKDKEIKQLKDQLREVQRQLDEANEETRKEREGRKAVERELKKANEETRKEREGRQAAELKLQQVETELMKKLEMLRAQLNAKEKEKEQVVLQLDQNGKDVPDSSEAVSDGQQPGGVPDKWKLMDQNCLGRGSFGKVYICEDVLRGRQLAVKVIEIENGKEWKTYEREVSLLSALNHERIVPFHGTRTEEEYDDSGKKTTYLYIFMEYMPAGSLEKYLKEQNKLEEALARKYTVQLLEGVAFLHSKKVVHRDIKCANVLRHSEGNIKLADFGCSKQLTDICADGKMSYDIGTAYWRAPESCRCEPTVLESDIWSVGATVVEMLTGNPPFHDIKPPAVVIFQVGNNRQPNIDQLKLSREAREFLEKCFKTEYSQRPSADQLLTESLWCRDCQD